MRRLLKADALGDWNQTIHAEVGHRLVGRLNGIRIQLNPPGIRQFNKAAGGGGEALKISSREFEAFLLPFGGYR